MALRVFQLARSIGIIPIILCYSPQNHEGYLEIIDNARRSGDLPWRGKEHRSLHLFSSRECSPRIFYLKLMLQLLCALMIADIAIASDPENSVGWEEYVEPKIYSRIPATELATLTCLSMSCKLSDLFPIFHSMLLYKSSYDCSTFL